jgi:uncharacterized membrane protein
MARLLLRGSIFRNILIVAISALAFACLETPVAMAQHGGGHMGGGHFSSGGHVGAPHATMLRPRGFAGPPPAGAGERHEVRRARDWL